MNAKLSKISSTYIFGKIVQYISLVKTIKLFKYNKSYLYKLNYSVKDANLILLMNKAIKPIANMEDYYPILTKKFSTKNIQKIFFKYLNCNKFIPIIFLKTGKNDILDLLDNIKLCYNNNFIESFYDETFEFFTSLFLEYLHKYSGKIKEISFMDNHFIYNNNRQNEKESLTLIKLLIMYSSINKIEDRYFDEQENSSFLNILTSNIDIEHYQKMYTNEYKKNSKNCRKVSDIICELKSYSLYFDNYNSKIIRYMCDNILSLGKNIEELCITSIEKTDSEYFVNSLKNLKKLKILSISFLSNDKNLYNNICEIIPENSLIKLELNCSYFEEVINLIIKNKNSLNCVTLKIMTQSKDNTLIIKTLSNIKYLRKLKLMADFPIIDNDNIDFLSLNKVSKLEISLNALFDLKLFFKKIPNLKKISFIGINLSKKYIKNLDSMCLDETSANKIQSIKFAYGDKNSCFFVLYFLSKFPKKMNIEKLSIQNIIFKDYKKLNELIKCISNYNNISSLELNYLTFNEKKGAKIEYETLKKLQRLNKFSFLGFKYNEWGINDISFIKFIIENFPNLFDIGISCSYLSYRKINYIFSLLKKMKYLIKVKIFKYYSQSDFFTEKEKILFNKKNLYYEIPEDIEEEEEFNDENNSNEYSDSFDYGLFNFEKGDEKYIKLCKYQDYFLTDIKNIDFGFIYENNADIKIYQNKIFIYDYFSVDNICDYEQIINNKYENYYIYQKVYNSINDMTGLEFCLRFSRNKNDFIVFDENCDDAMISDKSDELNESYY